jgi:hypothetical protein
MNVIFACAASAGAHAGLVPEHLREESRVGVAFLVAVLLPLASGAGLAIRPRDRRIARAAALLLAGLIAALRLAQPTGRRSQRPSLQEVPR